ncbi:M48 family metalloprotease [Phytoactinopolyspora limicola]|uniref:M48 family metalloprotease n=1 Tax=Phytoactinopolyspora limicola TaxID=2715536 RepID=UPI00140DE2E8|nr:M48 family metalloprotease [Phytoactinopolyspora limicola]
MHTFRIVRAWLILLLVSLGYGLLFAGLLHLVFGLPWWFGLVLPVIAAVLLYRSGVLETLPSELGITSPERSDEPRLHVIVDRLCALANLPKPKLKVIDTALPNAFTFRLPGRRPTVAVTRGLLDITDDAQLDAVLAHELAHVTHRDAEVMTAATYAMTAMAAPSTLVVDLLSRAEWRICWIARKCGWTWYPRFARNRELPQHINRPPRLNVLLGLTVIPALVVTRWFVQLGITVAGIATIGFVLFLIPAGYATRGLGHHRDLAADRSAAIITGQPATLAATIRTLAAAEADVFPSELRDLSSVKPLAFLPIPTPSGPVSAVTRAGHRLSREDREPAVSAYRDGKHPDHAPLETRLDHLAELSRLLGGNS